LRRYNLRKAGDYEGAVREYSLALAADAHHFKAHFNRAFSNDKLGRCARRRRARVLEYSSTRCPCQRPASADGVREGSVAVGPCGRLPQRCGRAVGCRSAAATAWRRRRYAEAIADYSAAIRIDARNPFAYYNRGIS
jgi:tetratricopeptide (TPR) repeat protein